MGAVVVYDVTDAATFESATHWIEEFRTKAKQGAPIILAANKMDLYNEKMRVPSEKGLELAESDMNCNFVECSAVSGVGINDIFNRIC